MDVQGVGMDGDTTGAVGHFMKIEYRRLTRNTGDDNTLLSRTLFVDAELIRKLVRSAQQIQGITRIMEHADTGGKSGW